MTRRGPDLAAEVVTRSYDVAVETASAKIRSSLFGAVADAGEQDQLAIDLADIFAWDVDFNTELQKGDSFRVAVEKLYLDGRFSRYGRILSAELVRGDRVLRAVRFEGAATTGYFAPDGTPLRQGLPPLAPQVLADHVGLQHRAAPPDPPHGASAPRGRPTRRRRARRSWRRATAS